MRAVIQRVHRASVTINKKIYASIDRGILVYLGICKKDTEKDAEWIAKKILNARIFSDSKGKMSDSILDIEGNILAVSQITLYGHFKSGNRPDMTDSMDTSNALKLYESFLEKLKEFSKLNIKSGQFGAMMQIESINCGPITLLLDSNLT